ncbi:MAG: hypothetical protein FJW35_02400 [Acidobacteria bacterium]|nr:hypothetical protein [Acidobacteriota bacterium]
MAARTRGGVLIAGLILITIGAIFLLDNWYPGFSPWRLIARYWPVLLIIIGLRKIYCYFSRQNMPPVPDIGTPDMRTKE